MSAWPQASSRCWHPPSPLRALPRWPTWLNPQHEKQRIIWAYKILFLDVLFPLDLDKIIFVDSDQARAFCCVNPRLLEWLAASCPQPCIV